MDRISWGKSPDGQFSVKSAYSLLTKDDSPKPHLGKLFACVRKVEAPERVRIFLWLVIHQVIMTNVERHRRHLVDSGLCQVCKSGDESILHVLRDCPAMAGIWQRLVAPRRVQSFFGKTLLEWMYMNLSNEKEVDGVKWATRFAMAAWWGWKWRCRNVFDNHGRCRDRVRFVKDLAKEVAVAFNNSRARASGVAREERLIA